MSGIVSGLIIGVILGSVIQIFLNKQKLIKHKKIVRAQSKKRQKSILERFRIEIKNNTIRLKKEEKRLALSKRAAPVELLFKNYGRRLNKVKNKEILELLSGFYKELSTFQGMNEGFIQLCEKKIDNNEDISEPLKIDMYNNISSTLLLFVTELQEKGAGIVTKLEDQLQK